MKFIFCRHKDGHVGSCEWVRSNESWPKTYDQCSKEWYYSAEAFAERVHKFNGEVGE